MFDKEYYLENYTDFRNSGIDPITHYLKTGWHQGKNPSPDFITDFYLLRNPDVRESGINPLVHYIQFGKAEGRHTHPFTGINYQNYQDWIDKFDVLSSSDIDFIESHIGSFEKHPKLSILMLVNDQAEELITKSIQSVINQVYFNWELITYCKKENDEQINLIRSICKSDHRCTIRDYKLEKEIPSALNDALRSISGEFFILIEPSEILREHALYLIAHEINNHPNAIVIYTDQDKLTQQNKRTSPFFKPDWNPDLFLSKNLLSHLGCFKTDTAVEIDGFQQITVACMNWDLAMRITEKISSAQIRHIPHICVHVWKERDQEATEFKILSEQESQYQVLLSHFARENKKVEVIKTNNGYCRLRYLIPPKNPLVSILIPTKDQPELLKKCIDSIKNKTTYTNYEILVIDNQSRNPKARKLYDEIQEENAISVIKYNYPFNFSAINNFAVHNAKGSVLVFLNDDIQVISTGWLEEMMSHAVRSEIGAVGAILYYPDELIQHAGIVLHHESIAEHAFYLFPRKLSDQNDRVKLVQNYSAVTGACLVVEKSNFLEVGGFNEKQLVVAYNDVDLCLRLLQVGYRNLWTPYAELYHFESASRGYESTRKKQKRIQNEAKYMRKIWEPILKNDPAYNPNLDKRSQFLPAFPPRIIKPWEKFQN